MKITPIIAQKNQDERGMAAILITLVMMIVITLIVLGFAVLSRREQRQTLDRQLSTQAYYAAESGINQGRSAIENYLSKGGEVSALNKTDCDNSTNSNYENLNQDLSGDGTVSYSCLLVNTSPSSLKNQNITDSQSWVTPLETNAAPKFYVIIWNPSSSDGEISGNPNTDCGEPSTPTNVSKFFPVAGTACKYPTLRVDLVDTSTLGYAENNITLLNNQLATYYFQPKPVLSGGSEVNHSPTATSSFSVSGSFDALAPQYLQVKDTCDGKVYKQCRVLIQSGPTPFTNKMAMRITSLYGASDVEIYASMGNNPDGSSGRMDFANSQVVIDATGRAKDVLRRVQVRLPISSAGRGLVPNFALQSSGSICKRYGTYNGYTYVADDVDTGLNPSASTDSLFSPMCSPSRKLLP